MALNFYKGPTPFRPKVGCGSEISVHSFHNATPNQTGGFCIYENITHSDKAKITQIDVLRV